MPPSVPGGTDTAKFTHVSVGLRLNLLPHTALADCPTNFRPALFTPDFSFDIQPAAYIISGVALLLAIYTGFFYTAICRRVVRAERRDTAAAHIADAECIDKDSGGVDLSDSCAEPVSVVVRSRDDASSLEKLLPELLNQEYAPGFEVIVVNEGASQPTSELVDGLRTVYHNLYLTFTPDRALNLSQKKLAVTLGVKAARYGIVLLISADTVVNSRRWLARMARHFANGATEVVLGYASPVPGVDRGRGSRTRAFNHAEASVAWLSEALAGRPYRGTEYNMGFRTSRFFANKGFSRSLNLREGVDDIFVNEIADGDNTAVELGAPARVNCDFYDPREQLRADRATRRFTARFLPRRGAMMLNFGPLAVLAVAGLFAWASVLAWPAVVVAIAGAVTVIALIAVICHWWHRAFVAIGARPLALTLPWLLLSRPLRAACFALRRAKSDGRQYTYTH